MKEVFIMNMHVDFDEWPDLPSPVQLGDWMIRERTKKVVEKRILDPSALCWVSKKRLFLKRGVLVVTEISDISSPVVTKFYFSPAQYTLWLLKSKY
jgi:hypothetical protein